MVFLELWSPIKTRDLVRQVIFFESKEFLVGTVGSVSVTTYSAWPQTKLFANDLQVVALTDHNDY